MSDKDYEEPISNPCGGYYCDEGVGHIDCETMPAKHQDSSQTVKHSGLEFIFPLDDKNYSEKIQLDCKGRKHPDPWNLYWVYDLSGAHTGPPIRVNVKNPREGPDGYGGFESEFDSIRWADDDGQLEDIICDTYFDAIRDDIRESYAAMD